RKAFVEEIRLLGMLRAVQSSEPRWLQLEDEIGWSARKGQDVETLAKRVVREGQRWLRVRRFVRWATAVAALVVVAAGLILLFRRGGTSPNAPPERADGGIKIAMVVRVEDVRWEPADGARPYERSVVTTGRLRIQSGRVTLAFFSGAS